MNYITIFFYFFLKFWLILFQRRKIGYICQQFSFVRVGYVDSNSTEEMRLISLVIVSFFFFKQRKKWHNEYFVDRRLSFPMCNNVCYDIEISSFFPNELAGINILASFFMIWLRTAGRIGEFGCMACFCCVRLHLREYNEKGKNRTDE